jgi:predicted nucleic acid-binding protein
MLFDTDVLIFVQRGHEKAAQLVEETAERFISVQTYMELLQDAQNKQQHTLILGFLKDFGFGVLPLSKNIGKRAAIYVEEYSLSHSVRAGDAIIAATAVDNNMTLITANKKHFKPIKELSLVIFKPDDK